jgi:hypothetical protein
LYVSSPTGGGGDDKSKIAEHGGARDVRAAGITRDGHDGRRPARGPECLTDLRRCGVRPGHDLCDRSRFDLRRRTR